MKGSDLKCKACGWHAIDVAPDLELDQLSGFGMRLWNCSFRCVNGHLNIVGTDKDGHRGEFRQTAYGSVDD